MISSWHIDIVQLKWTDFIHKLTFKHKQFYIIFPTLVMQVWPRCHIAVLEFHRLLPDGSRHQYTKFSLMDVQVMYNGNH